MLEHTRRGDRQMHPQAAVRQRERQPEVSVAAVYPQIFDVRCRVHAMALKLTGSWMVASSSENRQTIIDNYFQKSLNLIKGDSDKTEEDEKSIVDTFDQLAKFADQGYQEVMSHIKSDVFQKKKESIVKSRNLVKGINLKDTTKDLKKAIMIKTKFSCIDEMEIHNIETDKNNLLLLALQYVVFFFVCVCLCDTFQVLPAHFDPERQLQHDDLPPILPPSRES